MIYRDGLNWLRVAILLAPFVYLAARLVPYIAFYLLPFVAVTALIVFVWRRIFIFANHSYRCLLYLFPLTALLIVVIVGTPQFRVSIEKTIEWPILDQGFNNLKYSIEAAINWTWLSRFRDLTGGLFLPPSEYQPMAYGRVQLGWVLWLSLFLAAPVTAWVLFGSRERTLITREREDLIAEVQIERNNWKTEESCLRQEITKNERNIADLNTEIEEAYAENDNLMKVLAARNGGSGGGKSGTGGAGGVFGSGFLE